MKKEEKIKKKGKGKRMEKKKEEGAKSQRFFFNLYNTILEKGKVAIRQNEKIGHFELFQDHSKRTVEVDVSLKVFSVMINIL